MPDLPPRREVAVVGAGLAGLCAALHLSRAGLDVTVLESSDGVGGRVRTDRLDGFRLDRGFQVHNTGYPEAQRMLDHAALDLKAFTPGALVHLDGSLHRVSDPRRRPHHAVATLRAPIGSLADKLRVARLAGTDALLPAQRLIARRELSTYDYLRSQGLSDRVIDSFFRPFLSGVFLERELATSSRLFDLVWRSFARGATCVPAAGMQAIPEQLAAGLPPGTVELGVRVTSVDGTLVRTDRGEVSARAVVVATDATSAGTLFPGLAVPTWKGVTTIYHAAPRSPLREAAIVLDGEGAQPVDNTVVLSDAAPWYSASGRALVSSSVVGDPPPDLEPAVRRQLAILYGTDTTEWEHVATYRIQQALPDSRPPLGDLRRPVRLGDGRYVCGDHRDTASIQGAMVSGRRAAAAVLADL